MDRQLFATLYERAQTHRHELTRNSQLSPFFKGRSFPPVLGFGLPHDQRPIPMVTVALNAAGNEFPKHLPEKDSVEKQWPAQSNYFANPYEEWWPLAADMLKAASYGQFTYDGRGPSAASAAHVDVTAIVTAGGMDTTYREIKNLVRDPVRSWLMRSLTDTFVQLLSNLVDQNGTKAALVFGFTPAFPGKDGRAGNITLRDAFWGRNESVNFVGRGGVAVKELPTVAWGNMTGRSVPENLRKLPFFFVSRGPSSKFDRRDPAKMKPLIDAAALLAPRVGAELGITTSSSALVREERGGRAATPCAPGCPRPGVAGDLPMPARTPRG